MDTFFLFDSLLID